MKLVGDTGRKDRDAAVCGRVGETYEAIPNAKIK